MGLQPSMDPEECSKTCHRKNEKKGGQKLIRNVLAHPNGGAKCLLLAAVRQCNLQPCPVDCKMSTWGGWSKCSAACGGGVQQRAREVERAMKYGGKPCGATSQSQVRDGSQEQVCCPALWNNALAGIRRKLTWPRHARSRPSRTSPVI